MKKKGLPIAAAVLLTLSLAACGAANTNNTDTQVEKSDN